ncbi:MAG: DNA translocase FtsK 4TM domain-containing protein [Gammaproteobacteria bacterium]|nr:DNA translocase FtsK 4TM domain-containing protein [Gammaproteobacteria bacterium]
MSQTAPIKNPTTVAGVRIRRLLRESSGFLICAVAALLALALWSFHPEDPGWRLHPHAIEHIENSAGRFGAWLSDLLFNFLGYSAWILPPALLWSGARLMFSREWRWSEAWLRLVLLALFAVIFSVLCSLHLAHTPISGVLSGGEIGGRLAHSAYDILGLAGTTLLLLIALPVVVSLYIEKSLLALTDSTGAAAIRWTNLLIRTSVVAARAGARLSLALAKTLSAVALTALVGLSNVTKRIWLRLRQLRLLERFRFARSTTAQAQPDSEVHAYAAPAPSAPAAPAPISAQHLAPHAAPRAAAHEDEAVGQVRAKAPTGRASKAKVAGPSTDQKDLWHAELPPHSLLTQGDNANQKSDPQQYELMAGEIIRHLSDFGVKAEITGALSGPVVTRYEIQPAAGVKASKITSLSSDLARSLSVLSVRVVEVIPGKTVVGLEVPSPKRQMVRLAQIIDSEEWRSASGGLPLALGMDIAGTPVVTDLSRMPHLLVAGTTGSGKSVSVNTMMVSLLYHGAADQIRLIMIDPKMLELSAYEGIPQLLTPVITDMRLAGKALSWCVREMDRRYAMMAAVGVRNLQGYNHKIKMAIQRREPLADPRADASADNGKEKLLEPFPYIVVVIDEYADMMMVVGKKVETLIMRLSQKARAAGIHLILATQRPSVDVVTGLIKSNIPNRIAFQVSSRIDSRTILDQSGAEQLLGHGDMLMIRPGMKIPVRVHGAFVSDDEVHRVVDYLKLHSSGSNYSEDVLASPSDDDTAATEAVAGNAADMDAGDDNDDSTYEQAVKIVRESGRASISYLQRRLRIGYNRSATLLERMEEAGIVSALQSGGSREVLGRKTSE